MYCSTDRCTIIVILRIPAIVKETINIGHRGLLRSTSDPPRKIVHFASHKPDILPSWLLNVTCLATNKKFSNYERCALMAVSPKAPTRDSCYSRVPVVSHLFFYYIAE